MIDVLTLCILMGSALLLYTIHLYFISIEGSKVFFPKYCIHVSDVRFCLSKQYAAFYLGLHFFAKVPLLGISSPERVKLAEIVLHIVN